MGIIRFATGDFKSIHLSAWHSKKTKFHLISILRTSHTFIVPGWFASDFWLSGQIIMSLSTHTYKFIKKNEKNKKDIETSPILLHA